MKPVGASPAPMSYRETLLNNVKSKVCWWEWARNEDEDEAVGYGAGTDFEKVLNPSDGISVDYSNPLCPRFLFEEMK